MVSAEDDVLFLMLSVYICGGQRSKVKVELELDAMPPSVFPEAESHQSFKAFNVKSTDRKQEMFKFTVDLIKIISG